MVCFLEDPAWRAAEKDWWWLKQTHRYLFCCVKEPLFVLNALNNSSTLHNCDQRWERTILWLQKCHKVTHAKIPEQRRDKVRWEMALQKSQEGYIWNASLHCWSIFLFGVGFPDRQQTDSFMFVSNHQFNVLPFLSLNEFSPSVSLPNVSLYPPHSELLWNEKHTLWN